MRITSSAYRDGEEIPLPYAEERAGGRNISPPFQWSEAPNETRSFALLMTDRSPVAMGFVHWMVVDIPSESDSVAEGASGTGMPRGARELVNDFGTVGYGGPKPPQGTGVHPYETNVYALDVAKLDLPSDAGLSGFETAASGHVLAVATHTGVMGT